MNGDGGGARNRHPRDPSWTAKRESAAVAADSQALSTMVWNRCPLWVEYALWPETIQLLRALLSRQPRPEDRPVFVNRHGEPLGASGVRFKLAQYVKSATQAVPSLAEKDISPHTFRHAAAVALIAAGVDIAVIRSWLGHASIDTTARYAQANIATKHAALARVAPTKGVRGPRWQRNEDVLTWLDSL